MKRVKLVSVMVILALAALACSVNLNLPVDRLQTGPTQVEDIIIPAPVDQTANLLLDFGAGKLNLIPGAANLLEGTARYNVEDFKPEVTLASPDFRVESGNLQISGIPRIDDAKVINEWDFRLGSYPLNLEIDGGAYRGRIELGGLPLARLLVKDGASDVKISFASANPAAMESLEYTTGASNVDLTGLANANFATMKFRGGAGDYLLDFSGLLQRSANVEVNADLGRLTLVVPAGTAANLEVDGALSSVDSQGAWSQSGDSYQNPGSGPALTIVVTMNAGSLELRNTP